jgi:hypothetical protein
MRLFMSPHIDRNILQLRAQMKCLGAILAWLGRRTQSGEN